MTDTDPGERTRRELQAREDARDAEKSRYETMRMLISLEYEIKANRKELNDHIAKDDLVQDELKGLIQAHTKSIGDVSSSVATKEVESRYTLKELVVGYITLCTAIGGFIMFLVWIIGNRQGPTP